MEGIMKTIRILVSLTEPLKKKLDAVRKYGTTASRLIRGSPELRATTIWGKWKVFLLAVLVRKGIRCAALSIIRENDLRFVSSLRALSLLRGSEYTRSCYRMATKEIELESCEARIPRTR